MPRIKCPTCGQRFYTAQADVELTPRQRRLLEVIPRVARQANRSTARTADLAEELDWHQRTIQRELEVLEQIHEVHRPQGPKSGWAVIEIPGIKMEAA